MEEYMWSFLISMLGIYSEVSVLGWCDLHPVAPSIATLNLNGRSPP